MSEFTIGDAPILSGRISLPRAGAWRAELSVDSADPIEGAVTISIATGSDTVTLSGHATRTGVYEGRAELRVVGGAGSLATTLEPRYYTGTTVDTVLGDILRDAGETLADGASSSVRSTSLAKWVRRQGKAAAALDALLRAAGATWRILPDGTLWVGVDDFSSAVDLDHLLMDESTRERWALIATDDYPATLLPGTKFLDQRVSYVETRIAEDRLRTRVYFEGADGQRNDAASSLRTIIDHAVARAAQFALYPAKVTGQDDDGTLQLQPDDAALPALTKVPIRTPFPGLTVKVKPDARALVAFEGGDPRRPVVTAFEADASKLKELVLEQADGAKVTLKDGGALDLAAGSGSDTTLNGGSAKIARVGDEVETKIPIAAVVTTVTGQAAGVLNSSQITCKGTIKAGADTVKA